MGFQVALESEDVFAQSNISRLRVPGGYSTNRKSMRGTSSSGASDERRARAGAWASTSSPRNVGVAVVRTL